MKKIRFLLSLLKNLRNNEHQHVHSSIIDLLDEQINTFSLLTSHYTRYKTCYRRLINYKKFSTNYHETDNIKLLERERNDMLLHIKHVSLGATYHISPPKKEAGRHLLFFLNNYKKILGMAYASGVACTYNLIQDLRRPENRDFVTLLELKEAINLLEDKNNELDETFNIRTKKKGEKRLAGKTASIRRATDIAGKETADMISSLHQLYTLQDLEKKKQIENLIDNINFIFKQAEDDYSAHAD